MDQQQDTRLHLVELQNAALMRENEMLTRENEMLTRENAELRNMYNELKQSLDEALRISRQQTAKPALEAANSEASKDTVASTLVSESQDISERLDEDGCKSQYHYSLYQAVKSF